MSAARGMSAFRRAASFACVAAACAATAMAGAGDRPVAVRLAARSFPSVFQAWNRADNLPGEDELTTVARHDLVFQGAGFFGLKWDHAFTGLATTFTPASVEAGLRKRRALLALNTNLVMLLEIRYRDAPRGYLPADHPWWKRDREGRPVSGWDEGGYVQLDLANAGFRAQVAAQAAAAVRSGVVDGVMLDWWADDDDRLALIRAVREGIGPDALILANANDRATPRTAPFVNGYFMECWRSGSAADWRRIADTLAWAERNLRVPRVNCLETWYATSREDLARMRATTALSLVLSDGFCLFSDPNGLPTPDHLHSWYAFWDAELGRPLAPGVTRADGSLAREFERGTAVYNAPGNAPVSIPFDDERASAATGRRARVHEVATGDGDLFLRPRRTEAVR